MDAILSYGRPSKMELLTLIDRRFSRDLPIQPDYKGRQVDSIASQRVEGPVGRGRWLRCSIINGTSFMSELSLNHFLLGIKHLTAEDIQLILDTAKEFKEVLNRPIKKSSNAQRYYYCQPLLRKQYKNEVIF